MPPKTKEESRSSNLVRVRNNQRRSRARRREYVAELERKVQECNARGLQSCIPDVVPQDNIVQLKEENRKLRELLNLVGVEQALIDTHLVAEGGVPKAADASINWLQSSSETAQENLPTPMEQTVNEASVPDSTEEMPADSFLQLPTDEFDILFGPLLLTSSFDSPSTPQDISASSLHFPYDSSLSAPVVNPLCPAESLLSTSCPTDSSTILCSVAYELVREHNKRGVDMIEIGIRLWNGFVKGEGDGGCKVEKELLYKVLEYIKG